MIIDDILSLNYLKKQPFYGSFRGMRYLLRKIDDEEAGSTVLEAVLWPEPLNLEHTDEGLVEKKQFPFSEEGRTAAAGWLEEQYTKVST